MSSIKQMAGRVQEIWAIADQEERDLRSDERGEVEDLLHRIKSEKASAEASAKVDAFQKGVGNAGPVRADGGVGGPPGKRFIESQGYKTISDPANRGQSWSTGMVDVGTLQAKAGTVFESGQGGGLIPVPQVVPGVVEKLFEPIDVPDVFAQRQAETSSIRYINEGTAVSGAAGVGEGETKPASDLAYSTVDEPVKKIATSIIVSDELLDDVQSVEAFVGGRLSLFVRAEEARQLLRGGGGNELVGLFGRGINTITKAAGDDNVTAIAKVIADTRGSSQLQPSAVIMHPSNWRASRLLRDGAGGTIGAYFGAGPFGAAATNAGAASLFGQMLWDTPVVLSTVVGAGTALVGSFNAGAEIYRRGGVKVEASNSHSDLFIKDQVAIRSEQREALAVYRPAAFTAVSGLTS